jgi:hypothetical protein
MQAKTDRADIYLAVHKGMRACMARTLVEVGRVDTDDAEDTTRVLQAVRHLVTLCRFHLKHEDAFVHAAMEARRPGAAAKTLAEHAEHVHAFDDLETSIQAVEASAGTERARAMRRLYALLAHFIGENLAHMHVEETHNNAILWDAYSDAELIALKDRLVAAIPPDINMAFLRWIAPSLSPAERAQLFVGARQGMPPAAFDAALTMVKPHLGARDWYKLQVALGPLPAAA